MGFQGAGRKDRRAEYAAGPRDEVGRVRSGSSSSSFSRGSRGVDGRRLVPVRVDFHRNEPETKERDKCRRNEPGRDSIMSVTLGIALIDAAAVKNTYCPRYIARVPANDGTDAELLKPDTVTWYVWYSSSMHSTCCVYVFTSWPGYLYDKMVDSQDIFR